MRTMQPRRVWVEFDDFTIRTGSRTRRSVVEGECIDVKVLVVSNRTRRDLFEATISKVCSEWEMRSFNPETGKREMILSLAYKIASDDLIDYVERNMEKIEAKLMEERLELELQSVSQELQNLEPSPTTRKRL